jgi:hypothetical protein
MALATAYEALTPISALIRLGRQVWRLTNILRGPPDNLHYQATHGQQVNYHYCITSQRLAKGVRNGGCHTNNVLHETVVGWP